MTELKVILKFDSEEDGVKSCLKSILNGFVSKKTLSEVMNMRDRKCLNKNDTKAR